MRKFISLFIAVCIAAGCLITNVAMAEDVLQVSLGSIEAISGESISIPVNVENNVNGISNFDMNVTYDSNYLTYVDYKADLYEGTLIVNGSNPGEVVLSAADYKNSTGEGALLTLNFKVNDTDEKNISTELSLTAKTLCYIDSTYTPTELERIVTGGAVLINGETTTESTTESTTQTTTETTTVPTTEVTTLSTTESTTEVTTENTTETTTVITTERPTVTTTENTTQVTTERATEITTEITQATTEDDTEATTETVTQVTTENDTETTTDEVTQVTTESDTETTTERVTQTVTEDDTETTTRRHTSGGGGGGAGASSITVNGYKATTTTEATTEETTDDTDSEQDTETTTEETIDTISNDVKVTIGSRTVDIGDESYEMDAAPFIQSESNSTLVPLRFVALAIAGGDVENADSSESIVWDAVTKTAKITFDGKTIEFTAGSNAMVVDGRSQIMDNGVKAEITEGRMFVPFRALGNALGVSVEWDSDTKTAVYSVR